MNPSTCEILPDEILLEVCKYLHTSDILYSFMGLNDRLTQMIAQYRHHLSFYKTTITKFDHLCTQILPQIGWQIHSLFIDCCYSVLQDRLFLEYFQEKMSIVFPNLQRISLISYSHDQLVPLVNILRDLNQLVEIRLYSLFSISLEKQPDFVRLLFQANDHRLTTVLIDDSSTSLSFHENDRYLNIVRLRIKLGCMADLSVLFVAIPNVQYLDVLVETRSSSKQKNDVTVTSPVLHLTDFSLRSVACPWNLTELTTLLAIFPNIQRLSLLLFTKDRQLSRGNVILSLLPSGIQQFNYMVYLFSWMVFEEYNPIVASWPSSNPIGCLCYENYIFLHTIPWHFSRLEIPSSIGQSVSLTTVSRNGYEQHVERVCLYVNKNFSLNKSLIILSQCSRARELVINTMDDIDTLKGRVWKRKSLVNDSFSEEQLSISQIPELPRVVQIFFNGFTVPNINYYSIILRAVPNLFRLDLSFACLLKLIEDPSICSILGERILSLCIGDEGANSTASRISEEQIPIIASVFPRVGDIYMDINHLTNTSDDHAVVEGKLIAPLSSESFLLYLLKTFQKHSLLALCVDGKFSDQFKTDAEQWLRTNSILAGQRFAAVFDTELERLLIWM